MARSLLQPGWDPQKAADAVLARLVNICRPDVKGAHDADFLFANGKAYVVSMANDVQPGENPVWPFVYNTLAVVDPASGRTESVVTYAASGMRYDNVTLPEGAIFVPRMVRKDERTLRIFFTSENPEHRQSQTWRIDYDLTTARFASTIHPVELETSLGVFPMQPQHFYAHAAAKGFRHPAKTYGLYTFSIMPIDGCLYAHLNCFPGAQLALATLNAAMDRFTIIGDFFLPHEARLTESAVNRLPDGSWLAISRQDGRDGNYMFATSPDGHTWTPHEYRPLVPNGTNSKPTFDRFGDVYYLGWQEATQVDGAFRSVFNVDVSRDGIQWERKYRFATAKSFQYPTFREYDGSIYLTVTQGDTAADRKERIMFGKLEDLA